MNKEEARKLDAEVAVEIMGWAWMQNTHTKKCAVIPPEGGVSERLNWCDSDWETLKTPPSASERYSNWDRAGLSRPARGIVSIGIPYYSTDIAAAWDMEEEIHRRGLTAEYGIHVTCMILEACRADDKGHTHYDFLHASPELRCRAALACVRAVNARTASRIAGGRAEGANHPGRAQGGAQAP